MLQPAFGVIGTKKLTNEISDRETFPLSTLFFKKERECMFLKLYFARILKDRLKLTIIVFLLFIPIAEVGQLAFEVFVKGYSMPNPDFATFLALYTLRHRLHRLMFWYLPLFLLPVVTEDSLEDKEIGYGNGLTVRIGRSAYLKQKMIGSFLFSFCLITVSLLINMALVYLLFHDGTFERDEMLRQIFAERDLTRITVPYPVATNIIYILITAALAGMIAMVGTSLALTVNSRKVVYALTFLFWFLPVQLSPSLMLVIQPFLFVNWEQIVPTLVSVIFAWGAVIVAVWIMEVRNDRL